MERAPTLLNMLSFSKTKEYSSTLASSNLMVKSGAPRPPRTAPTATACTCVAAWAAPSRAHTPSSAIEALKPGAETIVLVTGASNWVGGHVAQANLLHLPSS